MNDSHGLRIGAFPQLTGISVRTSRHYGTHGVLIPVATDPATGYRFHSSDRVPEALLVVRLRDTGFPVRDIRQTLDSRRNTDIPNTLIRVRHRAILGDIGAAEAQLPAPDALDLRVSADPVPVTRTVFPLMDVISLREVLPDYNHEHHPWERLRGLTAPGRCRRSRPPRRRVPRITDRRGDLRAGVRAVRSGRTGDAPCTSRV